LQKYEDLRLKSEKSIRSISVQKAIRRMSYDYMKKLTDYHGADATKLAL
jgi:hypothetical protein